MKTKEKIICILTLLVLCLTIGCGEKPDHNANWYYYWEKDDVIPGLDRLGSPASRWDWTVAPEWEEAFGASHGPSDGYVLMDRCINFPVREPFRVEHKIRHDVFFIGSTTIFGVERAAGTTAHEKQHIANYRLIESGNPDNDGDGLADSQEEIDPYNFVIGALDTYDLEHAIHKDYASYGDNEFIARQAEQAGVNSAHLDEDWSMLGAQWGR